MKILIQLECLGLLVLSSFLYFHNFNGTWVLYLSLFFVPDLTFLLYLISSKVGGFFYNIFHHQGLIVLLALVGFYLNNDLLIKIGMIFLSHSFFDRTAGYGLKYFDSFNHTHLGWIGKGRKPSKGIA
jgi:hypothetical protein